MLFVLLFAAFANAEEATVPATQVPSTEQITGNTTASLAPSYYPEFIVDKATYDPGKACETSLKKISNTGIPGKVPPAYEPIAGMQYSQIVPTAYDKSGKLMVTWTVRIEGDAKTWIIRPDFCQKWGGSVTENYKADDLRRVETQLYVRDASNASNAYFPVGEPVTMEIPATTTGSIYQAAPPVECGPAATTYAFGSSAFTGDFCGALSTLSGPAPSFPAAGSSVSWTCYTDTSLTCTASQNPPPPPPRRHDPTLVGTYVLTAQDFPNKVLPAKIDIQIRWVNKTGMNITSPTGMRNMIVNFLPVTK